MARYSRVCLLIRREASGFDRLDECERLLEAQRETIAGDGIDGAGGVADQGDVASRDVPERAGERNGSTAGADGCCLVQASFQGGEQRQIVSGGWPSAIDECDAELGRGDRCDVGLSDLVPVDLDEVSLRLCGIVPANTDARTTCGTAIETGEASYA